MLNLRIARKEKGYTQKEIAKAIHVSQQSYSDYENGKTEPDLKTLIEIANLLHLSIDYLLGREDDFGNVSVQSSAPALSAEEKELLSIYRKLLPNYRAAVLQNVKLIAGDLDKTASKKKA